MSWTKEDQARLRVLHTKCMTVKEIAKEMQKPQGWIRAALEDMGYKPIETREKPESEFLKGSKKKNEIPKRVYNRITPETEKKICELREQCFTIAQIRLKLNLHDESTVRNVLKRNGYPTERGKYHKQDTAGQTGTKQDKPSQINREFDAAVDQMIAESEAQKEEKEVTLNEVFKDIDEKFGKEKEPASVGADASSKGVIDVKNETSSQPYDTIEPQKSQAPALTGIKMMLLLEQMLVDELGEDPTVTKIFADRGQCEVGFSYKDKEYALLFGVKEDIPDYGNGKY